MSKLLDDSDDLPGNNHLNFLKNHKQLSSVINSQKLKITHNYDTCTLYCSYNKLQFGILDGSTVQVHILLITSVYTVNTVQVHILQVYSVYTVHNV